jgi:hypothetical protein
MCPFYVPTIARVTYFGIVFKKNLPAANLSSRICVMQFEPGQLLSAT